jgi:hypothetical protein
MRVIVLTCRNREKMLQKLIEQLSADTEKPEVVICKDNFEKPLPKFKSTAWGNFQNGWREAKNGAAIFLEDDAYLCDNFISRAKAEIQKRPNEIIQFFSRRKFDEKLGSRYISMSKFSSCVCYYLPVGYAEDLLAYSYKWYTALPDERYHSCPSDLMMANWGGERKYKYWNVVPNLAQHLGHRSEISPKRIGGRVSKTFQKHE